jgi:ATP-dependent DNA helicase RecG
VEGSDLASVNDVFLHLKRTWLKDIPSALLHGKLKNSEKEAIMTAFAAGTLKVLVTTTVIEVGVNVPNATLMIVENADRFGLAQIHQLRGRVGRGEKQSYCVLITDNQAPDALARLEVLHNCSDGFELSEKDLELRGAGQLVRSPAARFAGSVCGGYLTGYGCAGGLPQRCPAGSGQPGVKGAGAYRGGESV